MSWKRRMRMVALAVLGLVLALTPVLVGCGGGEETTEAEITIGILADFSGAAAFAVVPTVEAFKESLSYYMEKDPVEGVTIKYVQYDHRLDYSKTVEGYQSLMAQGMDLFYAMGRTEPDQLSTYLVDDQMPTVSTTGRTDKLDFPWLWHPVPAMTWTTEEIMQWIADDWDGYPTKPKVGHQGWTLATTDEFQAGIDNVLNDDQWGDKFEWVGVDRATLQNVTWSASYDKFKDCDYIICSAVANSLATFVSQMRALGYDGKFVCGTDQFSGYWALVQKNTPAADLSGCYYSWWGPYIGQDTDCDWINELYTYIDENHASDAAARKASTGPISGWSTGMVVYEGIAKAAKDVGADKTKIDGLALQAAFNGLEMDLCETGNVLSFAEGCNTGLKACRIVEWDVAASKWKLASEKWYEPLTGCS
mgnify:CR=1 FL=1